MDETQPHGPKYVRKRYNQVIILVLKRCLTLGNCAETRAIIIRRSIFNEELSERLSCKPKVLRVKLVETQRKSLDVSIAIHDYLNQTLYQLLAFLRNSKTPFNFMCFFVHTLTPEETSCKYIYS